MHMQMHVYTVSGIIGPVARPKLICKSLTDRLAATLQLMEVQLTRFPGVEYDGKLLKARFDAMLNNCVQHIRSRVVEGHQRLLVRGSARERSSPCDEAWQQPATNRAQWHLPMVLKYHPEKVLLSNKEWAHKKWSQIDAAHRPMLSQL
jgi:hypothetical protein